MLRDDGKLEFAMTIGIPYCIKSHSAIQEFILNLMSASAEVGYLLFLPNSP
jgi:hypothetical protein